MIEKSPEALLKTELKLLFRHEQKLKTRPLYEEAFSDKPAFVDYYYREKCRDNVIAVKTENGGGKLFSMANLNPYLLSVCGLAVRIYMVAAVATEKNSRRRGHMRDVLEHSFGFMQEQGCPFCVLLPVDSAIYAPFGFEKICAFTEKEPELSALEAEYDIYTIRDLAARERRRAELRLSEDGIDEGWPDNPVIMARIICSKSFDLMAGQAFESDSRRLEWLRNKRICISDGV